MGEKRVSFGTSISRVIKDDKLPKSVKSGVLKALFENGGVPEYLLEELINSVGVRAERMYTYGRDHYAHGLPSGQFTIAAENIEDVVGTVLSGIESLPVEIDYIHHGPANNLHVGWVKLIADHGYNPATNVLGGLSMSTGFTVYLDDMVVLVPEALLPTVEPETLQLWGVAARAGYTPERTEGTPATQSMVLPSPVQGDAAIANEIVRVSYIWENAGALHRGTFDIAMTGFDDALDYFQVRYHMGPLVRYWIYEDGIGTHPTLDALFDHPPITGGSFFPFAYFRYNRVSELADTGTESYRTSKRLVKYLGMDYDQIAEAIDSNPNIGQVEQAMLMLAVPANTTDPIEQRYLWDFFNSLFEASSLDYRYRSEEDAANYALSQEQKGLKSPGIVIQDARFKMSLDNQGVYKRRKPGVIGAVGAHSSSVSTQLLPYTITVDSEVTYEATINVAITSHFYRRQVSVGYYDEIQVVQLRTLFHILGNYTSIGDGDDDRILLIPIDKAITQDYSIPDRETLYSRSLHFVFNSLVVTNVRWYQSDLFQFVLLIVAVVITASSWGSDGGSAIGAALAVGDYILAATLIFNAIVNFLVVRQLFKLFVKAVGIRAAFVIAIIAAVFGIADANNFGSVAGAPYAGELLMVSSGITTGIGTKLQGDYQALLEESRELEKIQKEQLKLLDTAKELLENNSILSPFVIFGEKPDDFYNRTAHSGNIGVVGIDAISSFVDISLRLPELNDTLGEFA
jgi:hypothetical protein